MICFHMFGIGFTRVPHGPRRVILRLPSLVIATQRVSWAVLDKQMTWLSALLLYIWGWPQALSSYPPRALGRKPVSATPFLPCLTFLPLCLSVSFSSGLLITKIPGLHQDGNICFPEHESCSPKKGHRGACCPLGWGRRTIERKRKCHCLGTDCIQRGDTMYRLQSEVCIQVLSCFILAGSPESDGHMLSRQRITARHRMRAS